MHAVDDGIWSGNFNLADVMFLVAFILCVIVFVLRVMARTIDMALMAAAVGCLALGWLVL